jgi:hypothetical protein
MTLLAGQLIDNLGRLGNLKETPATIRRNCWIIRYAASPDIA